MILVICSGLLVEVEMLDASAACVFHLLFIPLGSASPADGVPQGDTLIDLCMYRSSVGANHTFRMSWKKLL
jgi:hypothetical protein